MSAEIKTVRVIQLSFDPIENLIEPDYPSASMKPKAKWHVLSNDLRSDVIDDLIKLLPEGVLTREGECLLFNGEDGQICQIWKDIFTESFNMITTDSICYRHGPVSDMLETISNPLRSDDLFCCVEEMPRYWSAGRSSEFLRVLSCLTKGDRLYIGQILTHNGV